MTDQVRDARRKSFWMGDNVVVDVYGPKIGMAGLAVYACLCRHANNDTGESFPAKATIMRECGVKTEGPVERGIAALVKMGLVAISPRYREDGSQTSNLYTLLTPPSIETDTPAKVKTHTPAGVYFDPPMNYTHLTKPSEQTAPTALHTPNGGGPSGGVCAAGVLLDTKPLLSEEPTPVLVAEQTPARKRKARTAPVDGNGASPGAPTHGAMFTALAEVCHADKRVMGGRLNRAAKVILHAEYPGTPDEVRRYFGEGGIYWREHWKGRKGEAPNPEEVANWLKQARELERLRREVVQAQVYGAGRL